MTRAERGDRLLLLLGLANAGGVVAYVPLLTLLLPGKMALLAGEARVEWLGAATLAGAVAASLANIAAGWASDVIGTRRLWAGAGLCLTVVSYAPLHAAASPSSLVIAVVLYQVALNTLLSPIAAWAADTVPDRRKGLLGGLFGAGPAIGAVAGVIATMPGLAQDWMPMAATCALVVALIAPLLLLRTRGYPDAPSPDAAPPRRSGARTDFALLWTARLLVQIAGSVLFVFLLYYFQGLPGAPSQVDVARLVAFSLLFSFPVALASGRLSDLLGPRKPFLFAALMMAAGGLAVMACATRLGPAAIGYALFGCGSAVFLSLHSGYAMQLLPAPARRGRDLGVLNLGNTLPSVMAPLLALWLVPAHGFEPLLAALAALVMLSGLCVLLVRRDAQAAWDFSSG